MKFPPYYDNSVILGEFTQDTLRELKIDDAEPRLQDQPVPAVRAANVANSPFTFECDNPMDLQWGADGDFYLLTYGDGFFNINPDAGMYKWQYVKGTRAPMAVLTTDRTDGPLPLTVQLLQRGLERRRSGRLDLLRLGLRRRHRRTRSTRTRRTPTRSAAATRRSSRSPTRPASPARPEHDDHGREHEPDGGREHAGRGRHVRLRQRHPVHGHGHRPGGRDDRLLRGPGHVRARPRHARPRRGRHDRLLRRAAHGRRRRVARRQRVRRRQRDVHRPRRRARQRPDPEHDLASSRSARSTRRSSSSSTSPARTRPRTPTAPPPGSAGRAPRQPRGRRLDPAQRAVQPAEHQLGHVPRRGHGHADAGLADGGDRGPSGHR